ncbi:MAG: hypothetical protein R6V19_12245 [Armatimonadota bacterium]
MSKHARPSTGVLAAIFLTAASVLAFEVGLTRAFSVLLRYHFVFLAISLATCGLGVGGLLDYLLYRRFPGWKVDTQVALRGLLTAVLYPLSIALLFATPLAAHLTSVWVVSIVCVCPFLAAGLLLSRAFARFASEGGNLYFADLSGAAIGSFGIIAVLQWVGAVNAAFVCGLLAALGALVLAAIHRQRAIGLGAVIVLLAIAGAFVGNIQYHYLGLPVVPLEDAPNAKPLYQELADPEIDAQIIHTDWNAFARTDVVRYAGEDGQFDPEDDLYIYTDGEVPTNMMAYDGDLSGIKGRLSNFIGFYPFYRFKPDNVLLIGPGGGLDILLAQSVGAQQIVGAELNPSIPRIVRRFGDYNGHIYDYENVNIYVDEGRSFVTRSEQSYDLIYMALTKTATTASSSLALVESYIHTKEAFREELQHLTEDGKIAFVCQEPLILLRTMLTARESLVETGVPREDTLDHFVAASLPRQLYFTGPYRQLLIISKMPFTPAESESMARELIAMHLDPAFCPGAYEPLPFNILAENSGISAEAFVSAFNDWWTRSGRDRVNIAPCTDDQPFVIDLSFGIPRQFKSFVGGVLLFAVLISAVFIILAQKRRDVSVGGAHLCGAALYFTLLGIGFMLVEISLIQKLILYLGYPVLTLSTLLFGILLSSALGSLFSQRWKLGALPTVIIAAAAGVTLYGLALQGFHGPLVNATLAWDIRYRALMTIAMVFPLGFFLGMPFPAGLRIVGSWGENLVPWLWGINGLTSVVGSVAAMTMAKLWGFSTVQIIGWGLYAAVVVLAVLHRAVTKEESQSSL